MLEQIEARTGVRPTELLVVDAQALSPEPSERRSAWVPWPAAIVPGSSYAGMIRHASPSSWLDRPCCAASAIARRRRSARRERRQQLEVALAGDVEPADQARRRCAAGSSRRAGGVATPEPGCKAPSTAAASSARTTVVPIAITRPPRARVSRDRVDRAARDLVALGPRQRAIERVVAGRRQPRRVGQRRDRDAGAAQPEQRRPRSAGGRPTASPPPTADRRTRSAPTTAASRSRRCAYWTGAPRRRAPATARRASPRTTSSTRRPAALATVADHPGDRHAVADAQAAAAARDARCACDDRPDRAARRTAGRPRPAPTAAARTRSPPRFAPAATRAASPRR